MTFIDADWMFQDDDGDTENVSLSYPQTKLLVHLVSQSLDIPSLTFNRTLTDDERGEVEKLLNNLCQLWQSP